MERFDAFIRSGDDVGALRCFADEYYRAGKIGGTRKVLLDRVADRLAGLAQKDTAMPLSVLETPLDTMYSCPSCGAWFHKVYEKDGRLVDITLFCGNCGQRLDWGQAEKVLEADNQ